MVSDCELRQGRWQDALADVGEVDTLISDTPYGERTHTGHNDGAEAERTCTGAERRDITYGHFTPEDVGAFVQAWAPRVRGWFAVMSCHTLQPAWERALEATGRYVFSPLACLITGSRVRLAGDGPAQWSVWLTVARPRCAPFSKWGALPGGYTGSTGARSDNHIGGKPLWLMRALVRDYSRPGDLIVDPCAGGATTLLAARMEGRRAIGAELDPSTYALARKRLAKPYTTNLFTDELRARAANDNAEQQDMWRAPDGS